MNSPMAFCPRCHRRTFVSPISGGFHKCTVCGLEFKESVVITLARAVLYAVLILAVLLLVGVGVLFAGCALSDAFGRRAEQLFSSTP